MEIMLSNIFEIYFFSLSLSQNIRKSFICINSKTNCYMAQMEIMLSNIFEIYIFFLIFVSKYKEKVFPI